MALVVAIGCGNQYRPVVTPIQPTGPAAQPTADVLVVSQPDFTPMPPGATSPCAGVTYPTPSVFTLVDFSGDAIVAQANGGNGPLTFSLDISGTSYAFAPNCDGTLTTALPSTNSLLTQKVQNSTLPLYSTPTNTLLANDSLYVVETYLDEPAGQYSPTCPPAAAGAAQPSCVAQMTGSPEALKQEIPVAPSLINLTGYGPGERIYSISQGNSGSGPQPRWGDCDNPTAVTANGEADAIETVSNTISAQLPLGVCPVYGFMTPDTYRTFVMNRGSGTVTVINSQLNAIDSLHPSIPVGAGPVYADYFSNGQLLVTSNYDSNTISVIDVSLDTYGNDSATFGTVRATVPVGLHPVEVSVLQDGSRIYVANQGQIAADGSVAVPGSVSVVNLSTFAVEKTIPLTSNPHSIASTYNFPIGKVYVASQNSPYLTVIRTDTDIVSARPEMQGNIVDMRVSGQFPDQAPASSSGSSSGSGKASPAAANTPNYQVESRSVGSGAP